jgi:LysR family transcriptional regulator, hydrogen peroxide-inducible genes activator
MAISTRMPTLAQLRAFAAVAEFLHFRDAAAAVGMSQPALSSAIAALEDTLGTRLVERTTRRVLLTRTGERIAEHARRVLAAAEALVADADATREPFAGSLEIGVIPTVAPYLLPVILRPTRERYPGLDLAVHEAKTATLLERLAAGRLDLVITALPVTVPGLTALPLYDENFVLVVGADDPYAGATGLPRTVLRDLDVLLLDDGHCLRDQVLDVCREVDAFAGGRRARGTVGTTARAASLATLVQLVSCGLGATLLPETAVPAEARRGSGLGLARFTGPVPHRRVGVVHRSSSARGDEFARIAADFRRAVRERRLPVRVVEG